MSTQANGVSTNGDAAKIAADGPEECALEELLLLGTGTSGSVPNVHCLTRDPILCKVCFEATCYTIKDEETGEVVATGSHVPGMGGREISALLVGNSYFRAVLEKQPPLHDLNADRTAAINGTLRTPTPLEGTIRPTNDVFPERIPPPSADERPETPLTDYPETEEEVVGASQPHRRHVLSWNPNRRRNTSAALLFKKNGEQMCAVIDCGKNFYEAALEHFPKNGLRRIDALMITHGHADACFGLDDLRQWTIGPEGYRTQHAIDVYLNEETLGVVQGAFPYLVDKKLATGGGDVTSLRFHTIDSNNCVPFSAAGLPVTPFPVEHGILHSTPAGAYTAYLSLGFRAGPLAYISDISRMTEQAWACCRGAKVMVLDSLKDDPHPSHFGIGQAIDVCLEIKPKLCLLVGWSHFKTHEEINKQLEEDGRLKEAGIVVRAGYDGERIRMADYI